MYIFRMRTPRVQLHENKRKSSERLASVAASGDTQDQTCLVEENNREAAIFDATLQRINFIE